MTKDRELEDALLQALRAGRALEKKVEELQAKVSFLHKLVEDAYREGAQYASDLDVNMAWEYSNAKGDREDYNGKSRTQTH
jgi:hypothetical protein